MVDTFQVPVSTRVSASNDADAIQCDVTATVNCNMSQLIMLASRAFAVSIARVVRADMNSDGAFKKAQWSGVTLEADTLLRGIVDPAKVTAAARKSIEKMGDAAERRVFLLAEIERLDKE